MTMKKKFTNIITIIFFTLLSISSLGQKKFTPYDEVPSVNSMEKPSYSSNYPDWAQMLYEYPINFHDISEKFDTYMANNKGAKNAIIRYFKNWRPAIEPFVLEDGTIALPDFQALREEAVKASSKAKTNKSSLADLSNWTFWGPKETIWRNTGSNANAGNKAPWQVNVYAFDVSTVPNNDILFAGTETGFVNKSTDNGLTWELSGPSYTFGGAITAVAIDPTNADIVYVSNSKGVHKTTDGGVSWQNTNINVRAVRLKIDPTNTNKIVAATSAGVYICTDGGTNWIRNHFFPTWDIEFKPGDTNTIYAISRKGNGNFDLLISTDGGNSFASDPNFPTNIEENSGALLAVTAANPNIVYVALLSGNAATNVNFSLIYKGTNTAGTYAWSLQIQSADRVNGNLQAGQFNNGQGFFDLVFDVSPDNENTVFFGTTTLWKSTNAGVDWGAVGGYAGSFQIHPDSQDIKMLPGGKMWVSTDGGMNYSTDNFTSIANWRVSVQGLHGSELWGFDQGWNEDIIVGGRYHNGNTALTDTYGGKALRMGGAESATGWIVHGRSRQAAFDDIHSNATTSIPETINEVVANGQYAFTKFPNKVQAGGRRSNLIEHPNYHSILYTGEGTGIWKSEDMGATWSLLHNFGNTVRYLDISHKNPNVLYADVEGLGLHKSEDGGSTWTTKNTGISSSWYGYLHFVISPYTENTLYLCAQGRSSSVLKSTDGGTSWTNWSGTISTSERAKVLVIQPTSTGNDLVYVFMNTPTGKIYSRKDGTIDWDLFNNNFPADFRPLFASPFYRDGKVRVAGTDGVWESPLVEEDFTPPYITPWVGKPSYNSCTEEIYLKDHSIINHAGATWKWTITPTPQYISDDTAINPTIIPGAIGDYTVTLEVTKGATTYSKTINNMFSVTECHTCDNLEDIANYQFESAITSSGYEAGATLELDTQGGNTGNTLYTAGKVGSSAYDFDGTNTLTTSILPGSWTGIKGHKARTMAAWIKFPVSAIGKNLPIINMGTASNGARYTLKLNTARRLRIEINGAGFDGPTVLNTDTWYHVAVTMPEFKADGTTPATLGDNILYLNGVVEGISTSTSAINTGSSRILIGAQMGIGGNAVFSYEGQMDDMRIFNCELSESNIVALMNNVSLGVDDYAMSEKIKAFPVPTPGIVNVSVPGRGTLHYRIYSTLGQIVQKGTLKDAHSSHTFNLSNLDIGIYFIHMNDTNGGLFRVKVVKK